MPRIWVSLMAMGEVLPGGEPHDFCRACVKPGEEELREKYPRAGDGDLVVDDDHPPYEETDYRCEGCGDPLTEEDN